MILFKGLCVLFFNVGIGWLLSYSLHFYLFSPKKIYFFGKYPLPFSDGLFYRAKKRLISYLQNKLTEYIHLVKKDFRDVNFLTDFEKKIYRELSIFAKKFLNNDWLPEIFRNKLYKLISSLLWMFVRHLTRSVAPRIIIELQIEQKIDILDIKLDIFRLKKLFETYVYKYILLFNLVLFTIVGLCNMVLLFIFL